MSAVEGRVAMKSAVHDDPGIFDPGNGVEKQVPRGLVFSRIGKNKSPGDLFFPDFSRSGKTSPQGTCFFQVWKNKISRDFVFAAIRLE